MELARTVFAIQSHIAMQAIVQRRLMASMAVAVAAATILTSLSTMYSPAPTPTEASKRGDDPKTESQQSNKHGELSPRIAFEEAFTLQSAVSERPWFPSGGMRVLSYGLPLGETASASDDSLVSHVPLPLPSPLVAARQLPRLSPSPDSADSSAEQLANGNATAQAKSFNLLDLLFSPRDYAAKQILASNPQTAIYDIAARKVYLPGGQTLEAHSGFGEWMDDPASVAKRSIGVTPPNTYKISLRTAPFHGVRALRLTPEDKSKMFGRNGFLAHPFMLGETGQSNGCVSIRDYDAFLRAFQGGQITRLIVIPKSDDSLIASANENS